ncbi:MAG: hypothetical protein ACKVGZ_08395 [Alphaproteobacteria bacterium]|jgi:uncharacterized membrane protein YraQ (UPF0718 family)
MSISSLVMIAAVLILGLVVQMHPERSLREAMVLSRKQGLNLIPIVIPAIISAGFVAQLLPSESIGSVVGAESGFQGAIIAAAFGCLMPTGPMLILPVVAALLSADAGSAQMMSLLNAWSMMNMQRMVLYDIPLAGFALAARRVSIGIVLTPVAALLGLAVVG